MSGGVDSAVTAILLQKAIGDQLICVLVDTALFRIDEAHEVLNVLQKYFGIQVIYVNARSRFMKALKGISDPEEKEKLLVNSLFVPLR